MKIEQWLQYNECDLSGKVVALTGATGDLGSLLCEHLARLHATVLMLDRNLEKSVALKTKILQKYPAAQLENIQLDLSKLSNVHDVAVSLQNRQIDFLVLNAAVYNVPLTTAETSYNNVFQINFIAPYYLTKTLMPTLARCRAKVVVVGSIAHEYAKLNEQDLDYTQAGKMRQIYGNSKRWLMFALAKLVKTDLNVRLAIVHPGVTLTQMTNHYHPAINWLVRIGLKVAFPSPERAVLNLLMGVCQDCDYDEWVGPQRGNIWGWPRIQPLKTGTETERQRIYELAENIYRVVKDYILKV